MERRRPKHLTLIPAREFASTLATPTAIADEHGSLVFYDEAAAVVGSEFAEVGEVSLDEWTSSFEPRTRDSEPLPARAPADTDRARRATARARTAAGDEPRRRRARRRDERVPALAHADEFVGSILMFRRE